jgi:hypothetical protein
VAPPRALVHHPHPTKKMLAGAAAHVTAAITLLETGKALLGPVVLAEGHSDGVAAAPKNKRH